MAEAQEFSQEPMQSRDFEIEGPEEDIKVHQKGRVYKITNPETNQNAYFIDVTDRKDPSRTDIGRHTDDLSGDLVSDSYKRELDDPNYNERYGMWQGISMLISSRLDEQGRKRIYVGFPTIDITNPERPKELTEPVLVSAGFKRDTIQIPFTAQLDSGRLETIDYTKGLLAKEILSATSETPVKGQNVIQQAAKVLTTV